MEKQKFSLFIRSFVIVFALFFIGWSPKVPAFSSPGWFTFPQWSYAKNKAEKKSKKVNKKNVKAKVDKKLARNVLKSKVVEKITKRQAKRKKIVKMYKTKGAIGEADNGLLAIRNAKVLKKKSRKKMEKTVAVENSDREKLYAELARIHAYGKEEIALLRFNMFESYLRFDHKGVYYFRADHWAQK